MRAPKWLKSATLHNDNSTHISILFFIFKKFNKNLKSASNIFFLFFGLKKKILIKSHLLDYWLTGNAIFVCTQTATDRHYRHLALAHTGKQVSRLILHVQQFTFFYVQCGHKQDKSTLS